MLKSECIEQRRVTTESPIRCRLQNAWWTACILCLMLLMGGFSWLYSIWQPWSAVQWVLQAAAVNAYVLWLVWSGLEKNIL